MMLQLPSQLESWLELEPDQKFQVSIRGLTLMRDGEAFVLAAPRAFRRVLYSVEVELDGDPAVDDNVPLRSIRAAYQADDVRTTMTLYLGEVRMVRYDVRHTGNQRFRP